MQTLLMRIRTALSEDLKIRRVKDKQETPVKLYELIERKGEIPGTKRELLDVYEDGLSEYREKSGKRP